MWIVADATQLEQILLNLVINAQGCELAVLGFSSGCGSPGATNASIDTTSSLLTAPAG